MKWGINMKKRLLKLFIFFLLVLLTSILLQSPYPRQYIINIINYQNNILIDDFNHLNLNYWNIIEQGNNPNSELQYYYPNNVTVKDSNLVITAKQEPINNYNYTSGLINTKNKFEFLYGKIIFRAKIAIGQGLFSAVWLLPADNSFFPEIDIIEVIGSEPNKIWGGIHYLDNNNLISNFNTYIKANNDYAIYQLEWNEKEICWYVNGELIHQITNNIPNKKMYLIINLAIGGNWPKNPDNNILPTNLLIDYMIVIPKEYNKL